LNLKKELGKNFEHRAAEARWYSWWEARGYFQAGMEEGKPNYCIVIPPPNVTGVLHLGHALNNTLQDILIRYQRMQGKNVLWQPGTDHAGIATQYVVDRELRKEGLSREKLGREQFIARVWQWKEEKGGTIIQQLKRLGASCDWSRTRFTMDEGLSRAVREVFVRLYQEGLIYRGEYMVNWCPSCGTALSQLEVELSETDEQGNLWHVRYPLAEGPGHLTVATTRPETMLGDTAVAVHPEDERFYGLVGKVVRLPCTERVIPIIADSYVDREFGTGALKITPGHDFNDFEIGQRHHLPRPQVIDRQGRMTGGVGKYEGLDRFECRAEIVKDLDAEGLLEKVEPYPVRPGRCYRCHTVVEPTVSKQWFVKSKPLAEPAMAAVRQGKSKIIPEAEEKKYFHWMENIKDWCISRQIWWGHQIPAWHCSKCGRITVDRQDPSACGHCGSQEIERDPDVLDTWFSSALWPFSTLGWPEQTPALQRYYPNTAMITGFDILYFWVARMMMMGLKIMGEVPFTDIYLHGLLRDEEGIKFSKTKGNAIDPLEMIDTLGADALRFTLALYTLTGKDVRLSEKRIEDNKKFINKLWNAAKFALSNLQDFDPAVKMPAEYSEADRWIQSRLEHAIREIRDYLDHYRFSEAAGALYHFIWDEFCDWYIEWSKPALYKPQSPAGRRGAQATVLGVLETMLRLLHPFMPFVTEEIWQTLPGTEGSIMKAAFPEADPEKRDATAEAELGKVQEVVTAIRNLRGENLVPVGTKAKVTLLAPDAATARFFESRRTYLLSPPQVNVSELTILAGAKKDLDVVSSPAAGAEVCLHVAGLVDYQEEERRLLKEIGKVELELEKVEKKLGNPGFRDKAPAEIVAKQEQIRAELKERQAILEANLERVQKLLKR